MTLKLSRGLFSLGLLATVVLAGCGSSPSQPLVIQPASGASTDVAADIPKQSKIEDQNFSAPQALERKTAAYNHEMQAAINQKPKVDSQVDHKTDELQPSTVRGEENSQPSIRATWDDSAALKTKSPLPEGAMRSQPRPTPVQVAKLENKDEGANVPANASTGTDPHEPIPAAATISPTNPLTTSSELQQKLDKRVKEYPRDVSAHLDNQLMHFLLDDRVPDLSSLSVLPTEDREVVSTLIDGLSNFRNALRSDNNMLLSKKVKPLLEMADRLRGHADLSVPTIALCKKVQTYGEYDSIEPPQFAAGKDQPVILYCEVENFSSQLDEQQRWQTKLTQEAVMYTESGMQVWSDKSQVINDVSRQRRHDFFIVKRMTVPSNLAVGRYLLKVTIVDQQMSRVAEATLPIVIAVQ